MRSLKYWVLIFCAALSLRAADQPITGVVNSPQTNVLGNGKIVITAPSPFTSIDGREVKGIEITVPIIKGKYSVLLVPTIGAITGGTPYYKASYQLANGETFTEIWSVRASTVPLTHSDVLVASIPGPTYGQIPLSQLGAGNANSGNCPVLINAAWTPVPCATSGLVYKVFINQSTWTFLASSHVQGSALLVQFFDASNHNFITGYTVGQFPNPPDINAAIGTPTSGMMIVSGQGSGNYIGPLQALPFSVASTTHLFTTNALMGACYDSSGASVLLPITPNLDNSVTFGDSFSVGSCRPVIGGLSGSIGGNSGSITPAFSGVMAATANNPVQHLATPTEIETSLGFVPLSTSNGLQVANDLSEILAAGSGAQAAARANIGVGSAATHAASDFLASAGNAVTATALAATPSGCPGGQALNAITTSGAPNGPCIAVPAVPALQGSIQASYYFDATDAASVTTVIDHSGNGYNMTISGGCSSWSSEGLVSTGTVSSTCVSVPAAALNGAYAVQAWFRTTPPVWGYYSYILGADTGNGVLFNEVGHLQMETNNTLSGDGGDGVTGGFHSATWVTGNPAIFYVDGKIIQQPAIANNVAQFGTYSTVYLFGPGTWVNAYNTFQGTLMGLVIYSTTPTQAQIAANDQYMLSQKFAQRGLSAFDPEFLPQVPILMYQGDSICAFSPAGAGVQWTMFPQTASNMTGPWQYYNSCVGGQLLQTESQSLYASQIHNVFTRISAPLKIDFVEGGINDASPAGGGASAVSMYGWAQAICTAAHADKAKAIVSTITPSSTRNNGTLATYNADLIAGWLSGGLGCDAVADFAGDPAMGLIALAPDGTWRIDGLHWTTGLGHAVESYRAALAIHMVSQPGVSFTLPVPVSYKVPLQTAATTATINLLQLGPDWIVDNVALDVGNSAVCPVSSPAYAGTGISTVTASVGDSTGSTTQYMTAQSLTTSGRIAFAQNTFNSLKGIVQANFTSSGGNLSALTAGCATFYITVHRIP
jgi:hypothetical protein